MQSGVEVLQWSLIYGDFHMATGVLSGGRSARRPASDSTLLPSLRRQPHCGPQSTPSKTCDSGGGEGALTDGLSSAWEVVATSSSSATGLCAISCEVEASHNTDKARSGECAPTRKEYLHLAATVCRRRNELSAVGETSQPSSVFSVIINWPASLLHNHHTSTTNRLTLLILPITTSSNTLTLTALLSKESKFTDYFSPAGSCSL